MSTLNITRYVCLPNMERELALNPSAKVYREVKLTIDKNTAKFELATVTKTAAEGGYRNGAINSASMEFSLNTFLTSPAGHLMGSESWVVIDLISRLRQTIQAYIGDELLSFLNDLDKN